jgi:1-aminocyclopropane-1-carboxylate deaminase
MQSFLPDAHIPLVSIDLSQFGISGPSLTIKRDDQLHPFVSGNKFRKLKYNLLAAKNQHHSALLTFGGAFSNHIAAVAAAGKELGFKTFGIIRGEELEGQITANPTLSFAKNCGMNLHFISRNHYKNKETTEYIAQLENQFGRCYLLPEGGTNALAVKGCTEIITKEEANYSHLIAPVGTGGTLAGLVEASTPGQFVLGISALKGTFQTSLISKFTAKKNFQITDAYCFGGYGKIDRDLIRFINEFKFKTKIPLDPIYTGKMMYGIIDLLKKGHFPENSRIFAIHTGGLQGIAGMNQKLKKKNLPIIE